MPEPEMNSDDVMKEFESILKGEKPERVSPANQGPTDPEEFQPHERAIAKMLHEFPHMFSLTTDEMLGTLKRITFFIEHHKAQHDKG